MEQSKNKRKWRRRLKESWNWSEQQVKNDVIDTTVSVVGIKFNDIVKKFAIATNRKIVTNEKLINLKGNIQQFQYYLREWVKESKHIFHYIKDEFDRVKPVRNQELFAFGLLLSLTESGINKCKEWQDILRQYRPEKDEDDEIIQEYREEGAFCVCGKDCHWVLFLVSQQKEGTISCETGACCAEKAEIITPDEGKALQNKRDRINKEKKRVKEREEQNLELKKENRQYCPGYGELKGKCEEIISEKDVIGLCGECIIYKHNTKTIKKCDTCGDPLNRNHRYYHKKWYTRCGTCYSSDKFETVLATDEAHHYNKKGAIMDIIKSLEGIVV